MNHWAVNYIGLPYAVGGRDRNGLDCWGVLRLIYREQRGIELPLLPGISVENLITLARDIQQQIKQSWTEVDQPQDLDVVAMSQQSVIHHVGLWTAADGGKVIHCWKCPVIAETIKALRQMRGVKLIKFYRYGTHH